MEMYVAVNHLWVTVHQYGAAGGGRRSAITRPPQEKGGIQGGYEWRLPAPL